MSELSRRLEEIRDRWSKGDGRWSYEDFPGDLRLVRDAAAGRIGGGFERREAQRMLCDCYQAQGRLDQAEELLRLMLDEAESDYDRAKCLEKLFFLHRAHGGPGGEEIWRQEYEAYAHLCFQGLLKEDGFTAHLVLHTHGAAEQMGDSALLAAAAYVQSIRETSVVEQLEKEARYQRELERFGKTPAHLRHTPQVQYREACLKQLREKGLRRRCDGEMRWVYLTLSWAADQAETTISYPRDLRGAQAWANALDRRTRQFQRAWPQDVLSVSTEGLEAYLELARRYMRALELGNPAVARLVMERPEAFQQLWDYGIPAAACMVWATHETNRDPAERRRAGELGKQWLSAWLGIMTGASGDPACFRKWGTKLPDRQIREVKMVWRRFLYGMAMRLAKDCPFSRRED